MNGYATHAFAGAAANRAHLLYPRRRAFLKDAYAKALPSADAHAPLEVGEHDDAILVVSDTTKCLYDRRGERIESSCVIRHGSDGRREIWQAEDRLSDLRVDATIAAPVVYQSVLFDHWGHFLLESISRMWAAREHPELAPLAPLYTWSLNTHAVGDTISQCLSAGGLRDLSGVDARARVRLTKCFVPTASCELGGRMDRRHALATAEIARKLAPPPAEDPRPVYFSRSRIRGGQSVQRVIANEAELEARLEALGVRVVHMQELSLPEQIGIVNAHRAFIGPWGSAFHNILFRLGDAEIATFVLSEMFVLKDFLLVDAVMGNDAHYLCVLHRLAAGPAGRELSVDIEATIRYLREVGAV